MKANACLQANDHGKLLFYMTASITGYNIVQEMKPINYEIIQRLSLYHSIPTRTTMPPKDYHSNQQLRHIQHMN